MSFLNPDVEALAARLGWSVRPNDDNASELIVGDYARGFLLLQMPEELQLAQRPLRGEPSLKLRTNDLEAAQHYMVFQLVRLLRFREGRADLEIPIDPAAIAAPFALRSTPFECVLRWGGSWVEFGAGNEFAAAQFVHYVRGTTEETGALLLSAK